MSSKIKLDTESATIQYLKQWGLIIGQEHKPEKMLTSHIHTHLELNYLVGCEITYLFNKNKKVNLKANEFAIFWGIREHQVIEVKGSGKIYVMYVPIDELLSWKLSSHLEYKLLHNYFIKDKIQNQFDISLLKEIYKYNKSSHNHEDLIKDLIKFRLKKLIKNKHYSISIKNSEKIISQNNISKKTFEHIKTIMNYITSNINNKIKPKDIANSADIHPNYMMNIFKNTLGITVNELIDTLKMEQAYETMRSTKICLDQIIYNSGFLSKTSFYTKFKKHYGYSPHYFRKKYLHNQSPLDKENVFLIS